MFPCQIFKKKSQKSLVFQQIAHEWSHLWDLSLSIIALDHNETIWLVGQIAHLKSNYKNETLHLIIQDQLSNVIKPPCSGYCQNWNLRIVQTKDQ
jgi:hypothetical protein